MKPVNLRAERRKQLITLGLIIGSYIPFLLFAQLPDNSADSIIFYVARQLGYLAAVMLLWQFVLGTRSVSALVLKDRAWTLSIHKKLGIY